MKFNIANLVNDTRSNTQLGGNNGTINQGETLKQVGTTTNLHGLNVIKLADGKICLDGSQSDAEVNNILSSIYQKKTRELAVDTYKYGIYLVSEVHDKRTKAIRNVDTNKLIGITLYYKRVDEDTNKSTIKKYNLLVETTKLVGYDILNNTDKEFIGIQPGQAKFLTISDATRIQKLGGDGINDMVNFNISTSGFVASESVIPYRYIETKENCDSGQSIRILFKLRHKDVTVGYVIDMGDLQGLKINSNREIWTQNGKVKVNKEIQLSKISMVTPEELLDIALKFKENKDINFANFSVQNIYGNMGIKTESVTKLDCMGSQEAFANYCMSLPATQQAEFKQKYNFNMVDIAYQMQELSGRLPKKYISKSLLR